MTPCQCGNAQPHFCLEMERDQFGLVRSRKVFYVDGDQKVNVSYAVRANEGDGPIIGDLHYQSRVPSITLTADVCLHTTLVPYDYEASRRRASPLFPVLQPVDPEDDELIYPDVE